MEYLIAFLEFMLVASVGIILLPLSIWDGSKFLSEKFIGAIIGFFIKLLFCNIAIFLLLYGFISLAYQFATQPFTGLTNEILSVLFICLLFFFICKSAPSIAQSLLTGTPSLSATGAISAATGAFAAAGTTLRLGKAAAGVPVKTALSAAGTLSQAGAAAGAVAGAGGTRSRQAGAFFSSIGGSVADSAKAKGLGLVRSLTGGGKGENPHSWRQSFNQSRNEDGTQQTISQHINDRKTEGAEKGLEYLKKHRP